jgi:hypothetical protein
LRSTWRSSSRDAVACASVASELAAGPYRDLGLPKTMPLVVGKAWRPTAQPFIVWRLHCAHTCYPVHCPRWTSLRHRCRSTHSPIPREDYLWVLATGPGVRTATARRSGWYRRRSGCSGRPVTGTGRRGLCLPPRILGSPCRLLRRRELRLRLPMATASTAGSGAASTSPITLP